jgi:hypothetical protein
MVVVVLAALGTVGAIMSGPIIVVVMGVIRVAVTTASVAVMVAALAMTQPWLVCWRALSRTQAQACCTAAS